jgi:hypothetical protein
VHLPIRVQLCDRILFALMLGAFACAISCPTPSAAQVSNPVVTGPIAQSAAPGDPSRNYTFFSSNHDLAGHGYVEEEFFISGTATRYATPNQTNPDASSTGTVISMGNAYKTRLVVRRPMDPSKFNGVVLVEWYNVTNNFDAENVWFFNWENIMRSGYVWVGVSAQRVGVAALKAWSPTRYGTLDVTVGGTVNDDSLSYDVYSQAGQAIASPPGSYPKRSSRRVSPSRRCGWHFMRIRSSRSPISMTGFSRSPRSAIAFAPISTSRFSRS